MPNGSRLPQPEEADYRIRPAQSSDVADLALLEESAFSTDRLSRARLAALVRSPAARLLACWRGDALAGYALLLTRRGSRKARLYSIAVAKSEAGRGVGSRLVKAIEGAARAAGANQVRLEVREDNVPAIRLYQGLGYVQIGRRRHYYEDGADALLYARDLADIRPTAERSANLRQPA
jgi:ribosomal protein S18 acetylase RimI-like enzyme